MHNGSAAHAMPIAEGCRVFISYARKDGAQLAQCLVADLAANGFQPWFDTGDIAAGDSWTDDIERGIDGADAVLALLTPGSYSSRICRAEQLRALRKGKLVIPLLAKSGSDIPLHLEPANYRDFTDDTLYERQLQTLLEDISQCRGGASLKSKYLSTYVTAPPLPLNFVSRPDAQQNLRQAVLVDANFPSVALTALEGMGGIGKTILALALCHDEAVQQAFPDGILWVTAGKEPMKNLCERINEIRTALGDQPGSDERELTCINRYRTLLREKAALVIVDDVWRVADLKPFLAESVRSCLLFTTRDASIAAAVGAHEHLATLLTPAKSREVLARYSGVAAENLPPEVGRLVEECGCLPLALAMVGAMLRGKSTAYWGHVLHLLQSADLAKIRAQFPTYPHADLFKTIQVSVEALDPECRCRYLALAVLLEDMAAAPLVQQNLWNVEKEEALETAEQFISLSLAQRDGKESAIRLHDLQLDYVRTQHPDRDTLDLIRGAMRLSANVIGQDPAQFASQIVGRLLPYQDIPAVFHFTSRAADGAPTPWLKPLKPTLHPPGTSLVRTLEGHSGMVEGVAVGADGRRAVSASVDKTLKVWDLETGRTLCTLEGHFASVNAAAVFADGQRAISASADKTLKVWNLEIGSPLRTLEGHSAWVNGVAVFANGRRAISASADKTLKVWNLENGSPLQTLEGHSAWVNGVAVFADGRRAISASADKTLKVWDLENGRLLRTLEGHSASVNAVAVFADGRRAVSASADKTLKMWDLETGHPLHTLKGHYDTVRGVAVFADGRHAVSASRDKTLKVWDLETGSPLQTLEDHSDWVRGVAIFIDRRRAVSASRDKTLKVWDLGIGRQFQTLEGHSDWVRGMSVSADGRRAVSASNDKTLKVWDLETDRLLRTLVGHTSYVNGVGVSADGRRAVSASADKTLKVWDLDNDSTPSRTLQGHSYVNGVAVSADGRRAVSASADKTLKVWDLDNGGPLKTLEGHSSCVNGVAVSADGQRAVSASADRTLKVWDIDSGRTPRTLEGHTSYVNGVALSADGRRAVSASADKTLKVWDLEIDHSLHTLEGHSSPILGVAVSADGRRALSASGDHTVRVWNLESGTALATFTCDGAAHCCAFIKDNKVIVGDALARIHLLRLEEHVWA
jgi:WD40 repeat protein